MSELKEVLRRLPLLSKADLIQVRQRVQFLGGNCTTSYSNGPQEEDWLLEAFTIELRRRGVLAGKISKASLPKDYSEKSGTVRVYLLKGVKKKLAAAERLALGQTAASLLVDYLQRVGVSLSPKAVLLNVSKVPQVVDDAFPGYWQSTNLGFLLKGKRT